MSNFARNLILLHDSGFSPLSAPGVFCWLDSADASTVTIDGSSNIGAVNDKSGFGNNAIQGNTTMKPTYALNHINGRNAMVFDGNDDILTIPHNSGWNVTSFSFYCVTRHDPTIDPWGAYVYREDGASLRKYLFGGNGGTGHFISSNEWTLVNGPGSIANLFQISVVKNDTVDMNAWINGALFANRTPVTNSLNPAVPTNIGGGAPSGYSWRGPICEIIFANVAHNTAARQEIENYLRTKWGTP